MHFLKAIAVVIAPLFLFGCDQIQDEFRESGGFVGPLADKVVATASQRQQADRYALSAMLLAPMALDTAGDAAESRATILRVNELYRSLTTLYKAVQECSPGSDEPFNGASICRESLGDPDTPGGYSFEELSYEVQSDLYFIGRSVASNLDLDAEVSSLLQLSPTALIEIARVARGAFPILRRLAATYRDGVIILADAVSSHCADPDACDALNTELRNMFSGTDASTDGQRQTRQLSRILSRVQELSDETQWHLNKVQYAGVIAHIDRACQRAYLDQLGDTSGESVAVVHCGTDFEINQPFKHNVDASPARDAFWETLQEFESGTVYIRPTSPVE